MLFSLSREHGAIIEDGRQIGTTLKCPHCQCHFLSVPGSGKRRAWCQKCMRVTCGRVECDPHKVGCIPAEARLEHVEGRKTKYDDLIAQLEREGGILI